MMFKMNFKTLLINSTIVITIFLIDRISKIYILKIAKIEGTVDIYINQYLNFYLIWNNGIAFGLLSFDERIAYNFITTIIVAVIFLILLMIYKSENRSVYFLLFILGGSLGNLFDRIYYSAVPDFIDLHYNSFHWFIFNVADIFISIGVLCLILVEIIFNKKVKNEN
jgi:signal peptidase II